MSVNVHRCEQVPMRLMHVRREDEGGEAGEEGSRRLLDGHDESSGACSLGNDDEQVVRSTLCIKAAGIGCTEDASTQAEDCGAALSGGCGVAPVAPDDNTLFAAQCSCHHVFEGS